jgi:HSF-type DNA-binding
MLVLLHVDKEQTAWIEANASREGAEPPVPPIEWCTRNRGGRSDHVVAVYDLDRLVNELLPRFAFAPTSVRSFARKMCRWGFRQVSAVYRCVQKNFRNRPHTPTMFECLHFRRGDFALLSRMRSDTAEKRRHRDSLAAANSELGAVVNIEQPRVTSTRTRQARRRSKRNRSDLEGDSQRLELPKESERVRGRTVGPIDTAARAPSTSLISLQHQMIDRQSVWTPQLVAAPTGLLLQEGLRELASQAVCAALLAQGPVNDLMHNIRQIVAVSNASSGETHAPRIRDTPRCFSTAAGVQQSAVIAPTRTDLQEGVTPNAPDLLVLLQRAVEGAQGFRRPEAISSQPMISQGNSDLTIQEIMLLLQSSQYSRQSPR